MTYGEYEVTGHRPYRNHQPGTRFEAKHAPALERAIGRGNIALLRFITPAAPRTGTLPDGWPPPDDIAPQSNQGRRKAPH